MRLDSIFVLISVVAAAVAGASAPASESGSKVALLKIARDYRDGADGVNRSPLRAARFYEFLIDRNSSSSINNANIDDADEYDTAAEFELSNLLEADPTLSTKHSYISTLIRAAAGGHPEAQHKLSVAYATGVAARDIMPMDAGRAVFLEYMSALSGNTLANMGMGYRYHQGIGVAVSCEAALPHYEYAANVAAQSFEERGALSPQPDTLKLSEANDPSGKWLKREGTQELTDYYASLAEQGDGLAALTLGNMLLVGTRLSPANETKALYYLNLASEAQNPAGAGLQGYVMLLQHLRTAREEIAKHNGDYTAAQRFSQSEEGEATVAKLLKLLRLAGKKGDVNGVLGLGMAYFHGVGVSANLTKAVEHIQRAVGVHIDAGYYLGEIYMGQQSLELSATSQFSRTRSTPASSTSITTDGVSKGSTALETRMIENHRILQAVGQKAIDPAAASRGYAISAQMGHTLAQHRLAHLQKRGMGGPASCKDTVKLFKAVTERGPWMDQLAVAHRLYADGSEFAALYLFSQLAALGVESAQYNAAYILSRCTHCLPIDKSTSQLGEKPSASAKLEAAFSSDPLERQHRKNKHSTLTNFRTVYKDHVRREEARRQAKRDAEAAQKAQNAGEMPSAVASTAVTPVNAAFLPATAWSTFLIQYNPLHMQDELDIEFEARTTQDFRDNIEDMFEGMRVRQCETRALTLFDLSAQQGNAEAFVQLGDFYYYQRAGLTQPGSKKEAAEFYQKAADLHHTQAIFNLGIMHEVGDGVSQDFHLAKRFYDLAAETDNKARAPRDIALVMLEGHKTFQAIFGPDATSHLLKLQVPLPRYYTVQGYHIHFYTLWELAQAALALEQSLRAQIDHLVVLYREHVLLPAREVTDAFTAPLQMSLRMQHSRTGAPNGAQDPGARRGQANLPKLFEVEHSVQGYLKLLVTVPEYIKAVYDKVFDAVYLLLHYLVRGKPHPALADHHLNSHDVLALREELMLLILLCMVFCAVLSFKVLRRRLNEAVQQQARQRQRNQA